MDSAARLGKFGIGVFNIAIGVPVAYLGGLTAISWWVQRRPHLASTNLAPATRFAVLVPAHNEETTIATMLASMTSQSYPPSLFSVHVVADNCSDGTAAVAREHGAEAHERNEPDEPGKGPALNWLVRRLVEREELFDVAVFVDADTTVDRCFLAAIDRRIQRGAHAVQGYYGVRDAFESTPAALRYSALACRHHLRPVARNAIGGSCGLFGNGMAFRRDIIVNRDWTAHLVEDMEFQLELLLAGVTVDYEPAAKVEAEMPHTFAASETQHRRWETGRAQIVRAYLPRLLRRLHRPAEANRVAVADAAIDMCVPPLTVLATATAASAATGALLAVVAPSRTSRLHALVGVAFVATIAVHVTTALRMIDAPREAYRSLLQAPRLALWKVRMLGSSAVDRDRADWIRTRRNNEVDSGEVPNGMVGR
jgi:hypothetical protein